MTHLTQFLIESMVQGVSPGVANESMLLDQLRALLAQHGPLTVIFASGGNKKVFKDIVEVLDRSKDTRNRQKADFVLLNSKMKEFPVSLKNDKADFWESADTYYGAKARGIIDELVKAGTIKLNYNKATFNYSIDPCVAKKATPKEATDVIFGNDILPDGCVVCRTFSSEDFVIDSNVLTITCTTVITSLEDVKGTMYEPWFFIRSEGGRNVIPLGYRGLRALATYKRRVDAPAVLKV